MILRLWFLNFETYPQIHAPKFRWEQIDGWNIAIWLRPYPIYIGESRALYRLAKSLLCSLVPSIHDYYGRVNIVLAIVLAIVAWFIVQAVRDTVFDTGLDNGSKRDVLYGIFTLLFVYACWFFWHERCSSVIVALEIVKVEDGRIRSSLLSILYNTINLLIFLSKKATLTILHLKLHLSFYHETAHSTSLASRTRNKSVHPFFYFVDLYSGEDFLIWPSLHSIVKLQDLVF